MPPWVARPAKQVGEPAGGSLSADIYKGLVTVFLPIAVSSTLSNYFLYSLTCFLDSLRMRGISRCRGNKLSKGTCWI